jgi:hypothetical protein
MAFKVLSTERINGSNKTKMKLKQMITEMVRIGSGGFGTGGRTGSSVDSIRLGLNPYHPNHKIMVRKICNVTESPEKGFYVFLEALNTIEFRCPYDSMWGVERWGVECLQLDEFLGNDKILGNARSLPLRSSCTGSTKAGRL